MEIPRIKQTRIYEKVVDVYKEAISTGKLAPGEALPPERQIMEDMGVSRNSLREAFRVLELLGLIESIPGKGRFVRKKDDLSFDVQSISLDKVSIMEYLEVRMVIDPAIAAAAAENASDLHLEKIRENIENSALYIDDPRKRGMANFDFHIELAKATRNSLFVNMTKVCFYCRSQLTDDHTYKIMDDRGLFIKEHQKIFDAVRRHDRKEAYKEGGKHISRVYKALKENLALDAEK